MNRSYGSDIQNLLDVAVRYKTAQDEKDYRNAALLAEKGYREQRDKLELSITAINLLSKQNDEIDSDIDKLEPILMKYGIDTQKIKEKVGKDISPDTNEIISTADNSVESIMSGLQSKKEFNAQYLNAIQQEATRAGSLAIQYEGIYSRILSDTKNQSFKDRYADITTEELQSAISGGKFFEGDQQLTPDELKRVYSAVSTMGREDFAELSKHIEPITEYKDGKVITSYHPTTDIVDREFTGVPPADRQTDTDRRNAVMAAQLYNRLKIYESELAKNPKQGKKLFKDIFTNEKFLSESALRLNLPILSNIDDVKAFIGEFYDPRLISQPQKQTQAPIGLFNPRNILNIDRINNGANIINQSKQGQGRPKIDLSQLEDND